MTQQLYLAANLVPQTVIFGHLQIVYEDATGNLLEAETTSPGFPYFFGDWAFPDFGRLHDTAANTPGLGDPDTYAIVPLTLRPEQTAEHVWELIGQIHASLATGGHGLDYDIGQNSNSFAASALSVVGIDLGRYLSAVTPTDVLGFPGVDTDIFDGAKTGGLFSGYDTPIPLTLAGTPGNDYIVTGIGDDDLGGADGSDEIHAGHGNDTLNGEAGADALFGDAGFDLIDGGEGDDDLHGGAQADNLFGRAGQDTMFGDDGFDRLFGGDGDDTGHGGEGTDTLFGEAGNDTLFGDTENDSFWGGTGNDTAFGGAGDDVLRGGSGFDVLNGGAGDDTYRGNFNADTFVFEGAFGTDTIEDFEEFNDFETIDLSGVATITDFSDLVLNHMTQVGADVLIDDKAGNTILVENAALSDMNVADFTF